MEIFLIVTVALFFLSPIWYKSYLSKKKKKKEYSVIFLNP